MHARAEKSFKDRLQDRYSKKGGRGNVHIYAFSTLFFSVEIDGGYALR